MKNLRALSLTDLELQLKEWGEPSFRSKQIHDWIWKKFASDISEMTNLPKSLREKLDALYFIPKVQIHHSQYSSDGTIKNRLMLHDAHYVESVLIPTEKRMTVCVSSQVGCSLSCKFCATGYLPRKRNMDFDEIVDEVTLVNEQAFKLALSLHAATDAKRNKIMPVNETNNLKALVEALNYFYEKTKNEITFEYILFKGFNDSIQDADDLVKIYRQVPADLVNIIEYNPIDAADFEKPEEEAVNAFMKYLESKKVNARLRRSRGKDIDAACGQLANVDHPQTPEGASL
jgi:adenine C2-methylase RlmN of 23S rRNA A2503 and tRNA A37